MNSSQAIFVVHIHYLNHFVFDLMILAKLIIPFSYNWQWWLFIRMWNVLFIVRSNIYQMLIDFVKEFLRCKQSIGINVFLWRWLKFRALNKTFCSIGRIEKSKLAYFDNKIQRTSLQTVNTHILKVFFQASETSVLSSRFVSVVYNYCRRCNSCFSRIFTLQKLVIYFPVYL